MNSPGPATEKVEMGGLECPPPKARPNPFPLFFPFSLGMGSCFVALVISLDSFINSHLLQMRTILINFAGLL